MQRDPNMCLRCKYHSFLTGVVTPFTDEDIDARVRRNIFCNYACLSGKGTAMKLRGKDLVDTRGKSSKKCKLFATGFVNSG